MLKLVSEVTNTVAAGTPVFIKASSASVTATIGTGYAASPLTETSMTGSYAGTTVEANTVYTLGSGNYGVGFYKYSGTSIPANRAYVVVPSDVRGLKLIYDDTTTGIDEVSTSDKVSDIYDLQGRRVEKAQKGVYIVNGKKVLF